MDINSVPLDSIRPDPNQPRKIFDDAHIKGLAESLRIEGMINPIEVDETGMIITGECRWRAARLIGWEKVSVNINRNSISEYERFRRQMAENLHQSAAGGAAPMNAIDVALGYSKLIKLRTGKDCKPGLQSREEIYGLMKDIPNELGVDRQTVWEYLKLLDEPKYVLEDIRKGVPRTFYREIGRLPEKYQEPLKRAISEGKLISRPDIERFGTLVRTKPEKAEIELLRLTEKQNQAANRILNRAIELGLVLRNTDPIGFSEQDKKMISTQLGSILGSVRRFMGKMNESRG